MTKRKIPSFADTKMTLRRGSLVWLWRAFSFQDVCSGSFQGWEQGAGVLALGAYSAAASGATTARGAAAGGATATAGRMTATVAIVTSVVVAVMILVVILVLVALWLHQPNQDHE